MFFKYKKKHIFHISPQKSPTLQIYAKNPYGVYSFGFTVSSISRRKAGGAAVSSFVLLNINIQIFLKQTTLRKKELTLIIHQCLVSQ